MISVKPFDTSNLDQEVVDGLRKAFRKVRPIYPIVVAADGEILDGRHRMIAAPGTYQTYRYTLKDVVTIKDKLLFKLHLNYRRQVTNSERRKQFAELAEILKKEGVKREDMVSTLAGMTPFTVQYIRELLPDEYKMVERAHKEDEKPVSHPKIVTEVVSRAQVQPMDSWEHRKAVMSSPVSSMDLAVAEELQIKGVAIEMQKQFCLQTTIPDVYLPKYNLAIYLDHEKVHQGREDRDEALRELLRKRLGVKCLSVPYSGFTEKEKQRVVKEIIDNLQV